MQIDGRTTLYGIIGRPVEHSLSPAMHNAAFAHLDLNCAYLPLPTNDIERALDGLKYLNIEGVSITIPFKEQVMSLLDEVDPLAEKIGAVNTVAVRRLESGVSLKTISSLGDLVSPDNVKRILSRRNEMVGGRENIFNHDLARTLVEIARRWVKVRPVALDKLKQLASRVPTPVSGLTNKNKTTLRQFDDPANGRRLYEFSNRLWAEVKRDSTPNLRTLVKAQAALGVGILSYMPLALLLTLVAGILPAINITRIQPVESLRYE